MDRGHLCTQILVLDIFIIEFTHHSDSCKIRDRFTPPSSIKLRERMNLTPLPFRGREHRSSDDTLTYKVDD